MKITTLTFAIVCAPAALVAQQASATATTNTQASVAIPASYSAQAHANIEAAFKRAQEKNVPDQAMRARMAEGQAKAASDAQVAAAVQKTETQLEASQSAMIRAGRKNPTPDEVDAGQQALARGATETQVELTAKHTAPGQTLVQALLALNANAAAGAANAHGNNPNASGAAAVAGNASAGAGAAVSGAGNAAAGVGATVKGVLGVKKP